MQKKKCPKKTEIFVWNSKIICVYHKRHKNKVSASLHAVFIGVSGNTYFVMVILIIHGRKMRFSASSQNSISGKSIFGQFGVNFLNV